MKVLVLIFSFFFFLSCNNSGRKDLTKVSEEDVLQVKKGGVEQVKVDSLAAEETLNESTFVVDDSNIIEVARAFQEELGKLVSQNTNYPEEAKIRGIRDSVPVLYFLEEDGGIRPIRIHNRIMGGHGKKYVRRGSGIEDEALRVMGEVKKIKKWPSFANYYSKRQGKFSGVLNVYFPPKMGKAKESGTNTKEGETLDESNINQVVLHFEEELRELIIQNTNYPEEARGEGVTGCVPVVYMLESDGEVKALRIFDRVIGGHGKKYEKKGHGLEEEALRTFAKISKQKKWEALAAYCSKIGGRSGVENVCFPPVKE